MAGRPHVVYNRLLGGWYVVVGPHQTPLNGRFDTKTEAQAWLKRRNPMAKRRKGTATRLANGRFRKGHGPVRRSTRRR